MTRSDKVGQGFSPAYQESFSARECEEVNKAPQKVRKKVKKLEPTLRFCSFDCKYARAEKAVSADRSCMTFNGVWCRKLRRHVPKGILCSEEVDYAPKIQKI